MAYGKRGKRGGKRGKRGGKRGGRRGPSNRNGGKVTALATSTIPDRTVLRMRYVDNIVLSGQGGASRVFRLNSIYDPDTSITTGHQPLGFDQWAAFYNQYRVYKAVVRIKLMNTSSNAADSEQVGFVPYNAQLTPIIDDAFFEQPHVRKCVLSGRGGMDRGTISTTVYMPRMLGQAPVVYKSSPNTAAQYQTNPVESIYGVLVTRPIDGLSTSLVSCEVTIDYYCELFDRTRTLISFPTGKDPTLAGATDGRIEDQD